MRGYLSPNRWVAIQLSPGFFPDITCTFEAKMYNRKLKRLRESYPGGLGDLTSIFKVFPLVDFIF